MKCVRNSSVSDSSARCGYDRSATGPQQTPKRPSPGSVSPAHGSRHRYSSNIRSRRCIDKLPARWWRSCPQQPETQFNGYVIPPVPAELLWMRQLARLPLSTFHAPRAPQLRLRLRLACSATSASRCCHRRFPGRHRRNHQFTVISPRLQPFSGVMSTSSRAR